VSLAKSMRATSESESNAKELNQQQVEQVQEVEEQELSEPMKMILSGEYSILTVKFLAKHLQKAEVQQLRWHIDRTPKLYSVMKQ
jgi:uncharacterized membrane protein